MQNEMTAQCHCGAVAYRVTLKDGFNTVRRCNCSFCRMRGAVVVFATKVELTRGEAQLTEYRFNSKEVGHYFCSVCGIYTFHQSRSQPDQFGVNVACLEGFSPFDFTDVPVSDGINHPKDGGAGGVAGHLIYTPTQS
ncbi:GFA family protein (plasmid) [Pantoea agglomerans]|uniref:GFA family protein n=1 Tax=Enterobacter agglomerans TaxID=549 RepID=UPI0013BF846C|nr:GFA family protein [Pantoea agglomerans]NEH20911.1 GFA family protein [Pantoea agglomerans]